MAKLSIMAASFLGYLASVEILGSWALVHAEDRWVATNPSKGCMAALCPHNEVAILGRLAAELELALKYGLLSRESGQAAKVRSLNVKFGYCPVCHFQKFLGKWVL